MKKLINILNDDLSISLLGLLGILGLVIGWSFGHLITLIISLTAVFICGGILSHRKDEQNEITRAQYDSQKKIMTITLRSGVKIVYSRSKSTWYKMPEYERLEDKEKLQLLRFYDYNKKFGTYYKK